MQSCFLPPRGILHSQYSLSLALTERCEPLFPSADDGSGAKDTKNYVNITYADGWRDRGKQRDPKHCHVLTGHSHPGSQT